ncbi:MAG: hypothetical protein QW491_09410 [Thermoproteota archaeon]
MGESIEKTVLEYLQSLPDNYKWVHGRRVFGKQETISLFKTDPKFREFIVKEVVKTATDLFARKRRK